MTTSPALGTTSLRELEAQMAVIGRRLRRVVAERAAAVDPSLGAVGYAVLEQLHRHGVCRQSELVTVLSSEKGAVSRAVQQLVELGFVTRLEDPEDGRAHLVDVTPAGRQRLEGVVAARRAAYAERLADWDPAELEAFVASLARYNAALEEPFS